MRSYLDISLAVLAADDDNVRVCVYMCVCTLLPGLAAAAAAATPILHVDV